MNQREITNFLSKELNQILTNHVINNKILIIAAINALHTNTMAQVLSPDGDSGFFEILAGVLQGDTLAPYLFIISLDYAMRIATDNRTDLSFTLKESCSRRYPAIVITDTDFVDDIALLSDTLA